MEGQFYILIVMLLMAFYTDWKHAKIPNYLSVGGTMVGLTFHLLVHSSQWVRISFLGFATGFGLFLLLYLVGAVAAGDVKLFGAIGAIAGIDFVIYSILFTVIYAGVISLIILVLKKEKIPWIVFSLFHVLRLLVSCSFSNLQHYKNQVSMRFPLMYAVLPGVITAFIYLL
jgi:prepilin peptidase CpaA